MKLIMLTTAKDFSAKLIAEEAKKISLDYCIIFYKNIKKKIHIKKESKIILRDPYQGGDYSRKMKQILSKYYSQVILDKKCFRKFSQYEDKLFQVKFFQKNKVSVPPIFSAKKIYACPIVIKKRISSRGKGNWLIESQEEQDSFFKKNQLKDYIIQKFEKPEKDFRILILNNKILGIVSRRIKYKRDKTIKVKVLKGKARLPQKIKTESLRLAQKLGADFVGIDVIYSKKKYYFIEANLAPQFKGFARATGINVAKKIINIVK